MTKEVLKKNIEDMEIYVPVRLIERDLEMPKTTLQQVLNGHRNLPKKWVKVLEKYFKEKLYLDKPILLAKVDEMGKKLILTDNVDYGTSKSVSINNLRTDIGKVSFAEKQITELAENSKPQKEKPQNLSRTELMRWRKDNGQF
jgi:hypothetical protein